MAGFLWQPVCKDREKKLRLASSVRLLFSVDSSVVVDALTPIAQQKLSAVFLGASRYDSDFNRVGVGQVDGLLIAVGRGVSRCVLSTTDRHAVTAVHSLLDHCVHLHRNPPLCNRLTPGVGNY